MSLNLDLSLLDSSKEVSLDNIKRIFEQVKSETERNIALIKPSSNVTNNYLSLTPALTGKYVLPASYPLTTTPTKFMYLTIPSSGLYLISGEYNAIGNGGSDSYMHFYLAKNGVVISGTRQEPYTAGVGSQWPITINITETFNAGDEIQVYAYLDSPRGGFVYIDSTRSAFIQYTQLSSNVPVVATLGQYAYVSGQVDLVTAGSFSWTGGRCKGTFYKTSNGVWYLEFNIFGTTSATKYINNITITGVTFSTTSNQAISVSQDQSNTSCVVYQATYTVTNGFAVRFTENNINWSLSGKVELASKPTGFGIPDSV